MDERTALECKKIGERVRADRAKTKMSQAQLAEAANLSISHVEDIECGRTMMRLPTFIRLCEVLQVSADSLIRADIPAVNTIYQGELAKLLEDCTPSELDAFLTIVKKVKETLHQKRE